MGHARSLLGIDDPEVQLAFYEQVVNDHISVRTLEQMVKTYNEPDEEDEEVPPVEPTATKKRPKGVTNSEEVELLTQRFREPVGTKVTILNSTNKAKARSISPLTLMTNWSIYSHSLTRYESPLAVIKLHSPAYACRSLPGQCGGER